MANELLGGVAGNPPAGAGGSRPDGMLVKPVKRGALDTLTVPGTFET
jgi:hypothetical protein